MEAAKFHVERYASDVEAEDEDYVLQAAASYTPHWETEAYPENGTSCRGDDAPAEVAVADATSALGQMSLSGDAPPSSSRSDAAGVVASPDAAPSQRGEAGIAAGSAAGQPSGAEAPFQWGQEERDALAELGKRPAPPPASGAELTRRLCGLVDILAAYAYDWRMTQVGT